MVEATRSQLVHLRVVSPKGRRPRLCCAATQQARPDNKSVLRVLFLVRIPTWNFNYIFVGAQKRFRTHICMCAFENAKLKAGMNVQDRVVITASRNSKVK